MKRTIRDRQLLRDHQNKADIAIAIAAEPVQQAVLRKLTRRRRYVAAPAF